MTVGPRTTCSRKEGSVSDTAQTPAAERYLEVNRRYIPGGLFSLNRRLDPMRVFERAEGAYLYDVEGRRFIDYHAAFAPYFLGGLA